MDKNELKTQALLEEIASKSLQIAELRVELMASAQRIAELEGSND